MIAGWTAWRESQAPSPRGVGPGEPRQPRGQGPWRDASAWMSASSATPGHSIWQGSRAEVLRALSAGGQAVSVYHNVNALGYFSYAVDGQVLVQFELLVPQQRWGSQPNLLLPQMRAVGLDPTGTSHPTARSTRWRWRWPNGSPACTWTPHCWTDPSPALRSRRCWTTRQRPSRQVRRTRRWPRRSIRPHRACCGGQRPRPRARWSSLLIWSATRWWSRRWRPPRPDRRAKATTTRGWAGASAPGQSS